MGDLWDSDPEYYGGKGARWAYDTWWFRHGHTVISTIALIIAIVILFNIERVVAWTGFLAP